MKLVVFILIPEVFLLLIFGRMSVSHAKYISKVGALSTTTCGNYRRSSTFGRVLGGKASDPGEFPWITSIQTKEGTHFCAGFMVSSRFVISAAHCFSDKHNRLLKYNDGTVILDSMAVAINLTKLSDTPTSSYIGVKKVVSHPGWKGSGNDLNHDIAVLELQRDMEWTDELSPICLPKVQDEDEGTGDVTVAGWGYRQCENRNSSNELHKVTIPLWKADDCKQKYHDADYNFARRDYVCAGSDDKGIEKGDSGGPAMKLSKDERWIAIGIVSSGKFMCSDRVPGVYTKISSYLQWIQSQMQ